MTGFPGRSGAVLYCTRALGATVLTVEPWSSFRDVQEKATVFF